MFSFITKTWNPLKGKCLHDCAYCWVKQLKTRYPNLAKKYSCSAEIDYNTLLQSKRFTKDDYVFICDCKDLFGTWVSDEIISRILHQLFDVSSVNHLLLTKNPNRYLKHFASHNPGLLTYLTLGATVETDIPIFKPQNVNFNHRYEAPSSAARLTAMIKLRQMLPNQKLMLSIEPIEKFYNKNYSRLLRTDYFVEKILRVKPDFVAIGYNNNKAVKLSEPSLAETLELIRELEAAGIQVYRKTLREAL